MIKSNAVQILEENFQQHEGNISLSEWVECEAESDPNFFRFIFDEDLEQDFDRSLSDSQKEEFERFKATLVH